VASGSGIQDATAAIRYRRRVPPLRLLEMTWPEVDSLDRHRAVCILPVGAVEAHGPHLPLGTDGIIAEAMAEAGAKRLRAHDLLPVVLPTLSLTPAPFAAAFAGTLSAPADALVAQVTAIGRALGHHGFQVLAIANAHLDPANLRALHDATSALLAERAILTVLPDVTRKPWALRLGDEFRSGACHAGRYEGSIVLARRPDLVRDDVRHGLAANPASLSTAIREGKASFAEAGGPRAYFGDPAAANAAEGHATIATLGDIFAEAVLAALQS
jgi:creatinine amidohydrolase